MAPRPITEPLAAGLRVAGNVRQAMAARIVELLRRVDPDLLAGMTEVGLVEREFAEQPGSGPVSTASPLEVLERALAGLVERRPSLLASLGHSAVEVLSLSAGAPDDPTDTRRTVTVAFTDLEGFTRFTAEHGDAPAARLLAGHYRTAGPIVRSRGGRVVKRLGDGLLMTFPEPTAAVLAAWELVECPPDPLRVRAGLHVGEVLFDRADVVGNVVNLAAKVTAAARGGEVLVTARLREQLEAEQLPGLVLGRLRRRRLKGVEERVALCSVHREVQT